MLFVATVVFLFMGSIIVLMQFLVYLVISLCPAGSKSRRLLKEINCYLMYLEFAPALTVIYKWGNASVNIHAKNKKTLDILRIGNDDPQRITLILMNHSYELDYMTSFIMMDQLGQLALFKLMAKRDLSYLPVVGWSLKMCDIVFVKRNWATDKHRIGSQLNELLDYKQATFSIYAEGTRFTPDKYKESVEFSRSRNVEPLRYHLWPKSRGFTFALTHFIQQTRGKGTDLRLINLQCIMPHRCDFVDFFNGRKLTADMFCEEIELDDDIINEALSLDNQNSDFESTKMKNLLYKIYKRKDEIFDLYKKDGGLKLKETHFSVRYKSRSSCLSTMLTIFGTAITLSFTSWLIYIIPWTPVSFWSSFGLIAVCSGLMYKRIISETTIKCTSRL